MNGLLNISFSSGSVSFPDRVRLKQQPVQLFIIGLKLAVLIGFTWLLDLEPVSGFYIFASVSLAYWCISHLLPDAWLRPVGLLFSFTTIYWLFGPVIGTLLIGTVMAGIVIASLRIQLWIRMCILVLFFACLAIVRLDVIHMPRIQLMISFAGSFLMFRLFFYMFDVHRYPVNTHVLTVLSYFFLIPNLSFLLFPIIGYREFASSLFGTRSIEIYNKSVQQIATGIFNLLFFRWAYHFVFVSPAFVQNGWDFLLFILGSMFLYTRLSGIFLLVMGALGLFGYNLREPFGKYFFAPSFAELWRRINIYWHDFVVAFFFNGLFLRFKKLGLNVQNAIFAAIMVAFFITFFLHTYQELWINGKPEFQWAKLFFWLFWGVLIIIGTKLNMEFAQKKITNREALTFSESFRHTLNMFIVFTFMAVLTSVWNLGSFGEWFYIAGHMRTMQSSDYMLLAAALAGFLLLITVIVKVYTSHRKWFHYPMQSRFYAVLLLVALVLSGHHFMQKKIPWIKNIATTQAIQQDVDQQEVGYYDDLMGVEAEDRRVWQPVLLRNDQLHYRTRTILHRKLHPSVSVMFKGNHYVTNSAGYRDKEYSLQKDSGVVRYCFVGASYLMGYGVDEGQNFESLMEEKFNREGNKKYELLNFGVGGYGLVQDTYVAEHEALRWSPDVLFYMAHSRESFRVTRSLMNLVRNGIDPHYEFLRNIVKESGVTWDMSYSESYNRLIPYGQKIMAWGYHHMAELARRKGAKFAVVYLKITPDFYHKDDVAMVKAIAEKAGAVFIDISAAYRGHDALEVQLSAKNHHPNPTGHKLIAGTLFLEIKRNQSILEK